MAKPTDKNQLLVRDATSADLNSLTKIKDAVAVHLDRLKDAQTPTFRYLVLEKAGDVVGFACLVFKRPAAWSDAQDLSHLPQIVDVQILPTQRGLGYGTYLIRALEQLAAQHDYQEIFLAVEPLANPRAYTLYQRLGYRQIQAEPYLKHWEFVDSNGNLHAGDNWIIDMVRRL